MLTSTAFLWFSNNNIENPFHLLWFFTSVSKIPNFADTSYNSVLLYIILMCTYVCLKYFKKRAISYFRDRIACPVSSSKLTVKLALNLSIPVQNCIPWYDPC